jgi:hypothetical protein
VTHGRIAVAAVAALLATASLALAADLDVDKVAGVYKTSFKNGNIDGGKYQSEDILEIVKVSPDTGYVRTHLEFFNGHVCDIWGVANVEGDALVYRAREKNVKGNLCALSVRISKGKVVLEDKDGACAIGTCGNRGMYNGTAFDLKKRRPIRYMKVLTDSDQYKDSIDDHDGKPRIRMP